MSFDPRARPPLSSAPELTAALADGVASSPTDYHARRAELRAVRQRREQRNRRRLGLAIGLTVLVNLFLLGSLERGMHPLPLPAARDVAIRISVIEPPDSLPLPPEPQPAPMPARASRIAIAPPPVRVTPPPPRADEPSTETQARLGIAAPNLFNPDGSLRLPDALPGASKPKPQTPQQRARERWAEIERRGENPLDCQRTRFAGAFRRDESAGDEVTRKYLAWIGLADPQVIAERAARREGRAADGCDPPPR